MDYIIRKALSDEENEGWIWICDPSRKTPFASRTIVTIRRPCHFRRVYVQVRNIDANFVSKYNKDEKNRRIPISEEGKTIVTSEWYRRALGIRKATNKDNKTDTVALIVDKAGFWFWRSLRAACNHPDPVVLLGTRLGVLGAWLGILGIWLGVLSMWKDQVCQAGLVNVAWVGVGAVAVLGVVSCWGPPRPRLD